MPPANFMMTSFPTPTSWCPRYHDPGADREDPPRVGSPCASEGAGGGGNPTFGPLVGCRVDPSRHGVQSQ